MRDHRLRSAWIFGVVCPKRDTGEAPVCTHVGTASMNAFLAEFAKAIPADQQAVIEASCEAWNKALVRNGTASFVCHASWARV